MIERLTQQQKEELLRAYFAGGMTAAAEQEFFVHVALDDDLRQMLKAHSIVRSTLEQGHALPSLDHHDARARMVASLAARHTAKPPAPPRRVDPAWRSIAGFLGGAALVAIVATTMASRDDAGDARQADSSATAQVVATIQAPVSTGQVDTLHAIDMQSRGRQVVAVEKGAAREVTAVGPTERTSVKSPSATTTPKGATPRGDARDTASAPVVLKPAASTPSAVADTIREKSRDSMTFRLRVRKVEE